MKTPRHLLGSLPRALSCQVSQSVAMKGRRRKTQNGPFSKRCAPMPCSLYLSLNCSAAAAAAAAPRVRTLHRWLIHAPPSAVCASCCARRRTASEGSCVPSLCSSSSAGVTSSLTAPSSERLSKPPEEGGEETSLVGLAGGSSFDFHSTRWE